MTVQKDVTKNIYVGNGSTRTFPFTFECPAEHPEYIKVYLMQDDGTALATSDYQLDMDARQITYPSSGTALPEGKKLVIMRELPLQQMMNLVNNGPYFAEDVETAFDECVMAMQQIAEKLNRSIIMSVDIDGDAFVNEVPFEAGKSFRIADDGKSIALTEDPARVREIVLAASDVAQAQARVATEQATVAVTSANAAKVSEQNAEKSKQRASDLANEAAFSADRAATQAGIAGNYAADAAKSAEDAAKKLAQLGEHEANAAASAKAAAKSAQDAASVERRTQENAAAAEEHATAAKQNAEYTATLAKESSDAKDTILSESNSMRQYMSLTKENIDAAKNQTINAAASAGDYAAQAAQSATNAALAETNAAASKEAARSAASAANDLAAVAQDSADEAKGYADSIKDVEQELRADNARLTTDLKHANRRISVLYDLGKGITHRYETDSEIAYSKDVPSGAKVMDVKMLGGKSVAANNQFLLQDLDADFAGIHIKTDVEKGSVTLSGTQNASYSYSIAGVITVRPNHKFYFGYDAKINIILRYVEEMQTNSTQWTTDTYSSCVITSPTNENNHNYNVLAYCYSAANIGTPLGTVFDETFYPLLIDLTQMFGAGNEPTLEEFEAMLTRSDYPYNAGTLVSADVTAVQVGDKVISLPNSISLKSAGSVYDSLEFYEQDGKYYQKHTQRVRVVDLGTLTWVNNDKLDANVQYLSLSIPERAHNQNAICARYPVVSDYTLVNCTTLRDHDGRIVILSPITSTPEFTASLQGALLYYELATPIVTVTEVDNRFDAVDCKAGDKITFVGNSDYHLPVPNEEEYLIALNEVTV